MTLPARGTASGERQPPAPANPLLTDSCDRRSRARSQTIAGNIGVTLQRTATDADRGLSRCGRDPQQHRSAVLQQLLPLHGHAVLRRAAICRPADVRADRFAAKESASPSCCQTRFLPFTDTDAYRVLKVATEAFVMVNCGDHRDQPRPFDAARDRGYFARRDLPFPSTASMRLVRPNTWSGSTATLGA